MPKTLILGIGNTLLSDEGIGIHVLNYLSTHFPNLPDVRYIDGGTLSFTLAPEIEDANYLIVIDAARLKESPGTVRVMLDHEFDSFIGKPKLSPHEVGLADLIDISILTESLPERRALVGIEPLELDWGESPSPDVEAAVPIAASQVLALLKNWGCIDADFSDQTDIHFPTQEIA